MSGLITRAAWARISHMVNLLTKEGFTPDQICELLTIALLARKEDQRKK